ncbi:MAG: hypothetical protein HC937_02650 [Aquincola sp.]|nr:hypothetical protein [Aquincola sp.]
MAEAKASGSAAATETSELSLLDQIVDQGKVGRDAETRERGKDLVKKFVVGSARRLDDDRARYRGHDQCPYRPD